MEHRDYRPKREKTAIDAVIFDYGNVLSVLQHASDLEGMAAICAMPVDRFHELYWKFRLAYDRGELDGTSYWNSVMREENRMLKTEQISELILVDTESWMHLNERTIEWAERLYWAGIHLALLSNMPPDLARHMERNCGWTSYFNPRIFSCDIGVAKPDPAAYKSCLASLKIPAERILFLDDREENIAAAAKLGIHSLVFDNVESVSGLVEERFDLRAQTSVG